jgi:dihydroorotate dehydrogenase electron transfer subunit
MTTAKVQKKLFDATVLENYPLRQRGRLGNYLIRLRLDEPVTCHAGQFFKFNVVDPEHIEKTGYEYINEAEDVIRMKQRHERDDFATHQPLISRPYSIGCAETEDNHTILTFIYKIFGPGSQRVSQAKPGETLSVQGPLGGRTFYLPKGKKRAVMVGGGVGLPPMLFLTRELLEKSIESVQLFIGATTSDGLPLSPDLQAKLSSGAGGKLPTIYHSLADRKVQFQIATDDGSEGHHGFVTDLLAESLEKLSPEETMVYTCGPWPMLAKVVAMAKAKGFACQTCLEEMMGCGIGACQSCVIKLKSDNEQGWDYGLVCRDGPVFDADEIVWEK